MGSIFQPIVLREEALIPGGSTITNFELGASFPNPAPVKSVTTVQYALPNARDVSLKLYDVQDPNVVSLYFTQYVVEDLINHPDLQDVFGVDLDVYRAVDSVFRVLRPPQ